MNEPNLKNNWISLNDKTTSAKLRLFCLPYAGGNSFIYRNWQNQFPDEIQVCAVNLPGRVNRLAEPAHSDLISLTKAIKDGLLPFFDRPFALMGHSMGGIIIFELTRLLRRLGLPMPLKLFVSACEAPQIPLADPPSYDLPEPELIEELRRLKGTPAEILANRELLKIFLPVIRADFSVFQTYRYVEESPLDVPITALRGLYDKDVSEDSVLAWKKQATKEFNFYEISGDHFFCHSEKDQVIEILTQELSAYTGYMGF